jgi:ornithine carbamoyltransferase
MAKRDLLTIFDLSLDEVQYLLKRGAELKALYEKGEQVRPLEGRTVALIFEKSSTRTRVSFEVGVQQLGGQPLVLNSRDSQMGRGEPIRDTARVLSQYVHGIMLRTYAQSTLEELARWSTIPVINGLSDLYHPCQVLSDLMTSEEQTGKKASDLVYAWIGDGNNMCHSWLAAVAAVGAKLQVAAPDGHRPDAIMVDRARSMGAEVVLTDDPRQAVAGADVVNTDVWASMGQEAEAEARMKLFAPYQVNAELMAQANEGAIFLHCLPAHRGEEVSEEVFESPASRVFVQAGNRLHVQKAIMEYLMVGRVSAA